MFKFYNTLSRKIEEFVAFDFQVIEAVPTEPHDVKMDTVVSEN